MEKSSIKYNMPIIGNYEYLAATIFFLGFIFSFFVDNFPLSLRVLGHRLDKFPISTLRSTQVMVLNRFGTAFFFASAGFLVDIGFGPGGFLILFSMTMIISGLLTLLYIRKWKLISMSFLKYVFSSKEILKTRVASFSIKRILINYPCLFNLIGLSAPIILASLFPDYRGTLLQLGFLFNSISTLLVVFVIEPKFINHISSNDYELADLYHQELIISKGSILIMMGCFFYVLSFMY